MNTIKSSHTTTAEHYIGSLLVVNSNSFIPGLTGNKLIFFQLDKMAKLGMYGKQHKAIILSPHWQYHLKCTGGDVSVTALMDPSVLPLHSLQSLYLF